jgi:hypothetical protein
VVDHTPGCQHDREADVLISNTPGLFVTDPAAGCANQWDLQGVTTHEFGHVFDSGTCRTPSTAP